MTKSKPPHDATHLERFKRIQLFTHYINGAPLGALEQKLKISATLSLAWRLLTNCSKNDQVQKEQISLSHNPFTGIQTNPALHSTLMVSWGVH